jgi:hypothetical protein
MSDMISKVKFNKHVKAIQIPEGFTATMETEQRGWNNHPIPTLVYVVTNGDIEIRFDQTGAGHTLFNEGGNQLSFDRLGVEDSFYHLPLWDGDSGEYDLNVILQEQLERVAEYFEYKKTAISVPGIPHTISPDRLAMFKARLKKSGQISFMPSGFGTGYVVTTRMVRGAKPASKALNEFFGVGQLFVSTMEMD